jgi:hypothetical protein
MTKEALAGFFGLGFSQKPPESSGRPRIGYKGHGTKIYYLAKEVWVATRMADGPLLLAHVPEARKKITQTELPEPSLWVGAEAEEKARALRLKSVQQAS